LKKKKKKKKAAEDWGGGELIFGRGWWFPGRCGDAERVKKLWTMITLAGIEPNTRLVNSFIANCNSPERALIAFNKCGSPPPRPRPHLTPAALLPPPIYHC
jgi:hypothetical protein